MHHLPVIGKRVVGQGVRKGVYVVKALVVNNLVIGQQANLCLGVIVFDALGQQGGATHIVTFWGISGYYQEALFCYWFQLFLLGLVCPWHESPCPQTQHIVFCRLSLDIQQDNHLGLFVLNVGLALY